MSKNAEFSLRFSKNINELNEILFAFELNVNDYFSTRANTLSMTIETFENATNYIYDSKKEKYQFFRVEILNSKKKKNRVKIEKKNSSKVEKKTKRQKKFRQLNSFELTIMCRKK